MRANSHNTTGQCERCRKAKPFVLASAFQGDGTATFRFLCASCERIERGRNQLSLYAGMTFATVEEAEEVFEEPEPVEIETPQLDLFTLAEMRQY
jgi:hypothetical protein